MLQKSSHYFLRLVLLLPLLIKERTGLRTPLTTKVIRPFWKQPHFLEIAISDHCNNNMNQYKCNKHYQWYWMGPGNNTENWESNSKENIKKDSCDRVDSIRHTSDLNTYIKKLLVSKRLPMIPLC